MEVDARRPKRPKRRGPKRPKRGDPVRPGLVDGRGRRQLQGEPATAASCRSTGGWIKIYSEVQMTR